MPKNFQRKEKIIDSNNIDKKYRITDSIHDFCEKTNIYNGGDTTKAHQSKYNTYTRRVSDLNKFKKFIHDEYPKFEYTYQFTNEMVSEYIKYLSTIKNRNGDFYKPNSKYTFFTSFKTYVDFLADSNCISKNFYQYVYSNKYNSTNKKSASIDAETGWIEAEDILTSYNNLERFKSKGTYYRNKCILDLLVMGLRRDEIRKQTWGNFDEVNGTLTVFHEKINKKDTIHLTEEITNDLISYKETLNNQYKTNNAYVFCGNAIGGDCRKQNKKSDKIMTAQNFRKIIVQITEGIVDSNNCNVTARTFRKTFVVQNLKLGTPLALIQNYTDHTIGVLQNHYSTYVPNNNFDSSKYIDDYYQYIKTGKKEEKSITANDVLKNEKLMEELMPFFIAKLTKLTSAINS